jgi:hypothetical protein
VGTEFDEPTFARQISRQMDIASDTFKLQTACGFQDPCSSALEPRSLHDASMIPPRRKEQQKQNTDAAMPRAKHEVKQAPNWSSGKVLACPSHDRRW